MAGVSSLTSGPTLKKALYGSATWSSRGTRVSADKKKQDGAKEAQI